MPHRLKRLVKRSKTSEAVWDVLEKNRNQYESEIIWIKVQWHRILNGYWFYQNGTPIYIHGTHYAYCSFWELDEGLPEYRDRDRSFFLFGKYCETTTETFDPEFLDRKGNPIPDEDGKYRMIDVGRRVCAGFVYPKHRREGATYKSQCYLYFYTIIRMNCHSGIQSMDGDSAEEVFKIKLKEPWKKLPFFLRPIYSGSNDSAKSLELKPPAKRIKVGEGSLLNNEDGLQSFIDFADSAKRGHYDGKKPKFLHIDEIGKCLSINTLVKMRDGSDKKVQDIVEGDVLMGPGGSGRTVVALGGGREQMYEVVPNKGETWGCNENHILSLIASTKRAKDWYGVEQGEVVNMSVIDYLKLHDEGRRCLELYRIIPVVDGFEMGKTKFTIRSTGIGDYYGFTLKEGPLFLLGDYTVTHNTILEDVDARNIVLMRCLTVGKRIIGMSTHTSTVAEQTKQGGENMKKICGKSMWHKRNANGETLSKLFVLFTSAADGLEGFVDEYGRSVINDPTPEQSEYIGETIGALEYRKNITDMAQAAGDYNQYNEELRQHPIFYRHCFLGNQKQSSFNLQIINDRIYVLEQDEDQTERGNFDWATTREADYPQVIWTPDPEGKWTISHIPSAAMQNRMYQKDGHWHPEFPGAYKHSADPFRFNKKSVSKKELSRDSRSKSNGGGSTFWPRDIKVDPMDKDVSKWQSHRFVCTYNNRVDDKIEYANDMLMQTVFFGGMMYPERNMPVVIERFIEWGFGGFLQYDVDEKGRPKEDAGFYIGNNDLVKQDMWAKVMHYIQIHGARERHIEFLEECKEIGGIDELKLYDLFASCAGCLIGLENFYGEVEHIKPHEQKVDISSYLPTYDIS